MSAPANPQADHTIDIARFLVETDDWLIDPHARIGAAILGNWPDASPASILRGLKIAGDIRCADTAWRRIAPFIAPRQRP